MARRLSPTRTIIASFATEQSTIAAGQSSALGEYEEGLYVLQLVSGPCSGIPSSATTPLSCSLSNKSVQTYDKGTHALIHSIGRAHGGPITDLCHTGVEGNAVITSGADGLVRLFDLRVSAACGASSAAAAANTSKALSRAVAEVCLPRKEEALSVSIGYGGALAAVGGSRGLIHFYDLRSVGGPGVGNGGTSSNTDDRPSLLGTYEDAHTEEVTRVRFQPSPDLSGTTTSLLVSSSEDGLVCTHDTSKPNEEAALSSVLNVGTPLRDVGFFGPAGEGLYCLTGSETISVWHHDSAQRLCDFGADVRDHLSNSAGCDIGYLVGCTWDGNELSLLGGNSEGNAAVFRIDAGSMTLSHTMSGGHKGCVRGFVVSRDVIQSRHRVLVTGGEDARLCEWHLDGEQQQQHQQPQQQTSPLHVAGRHPPSSRLLGRERGPGARGGGPIKHSRKKNPSDKPY